MVFSVMNDIHHFKGITISGIGTLSLVIANDITHH